MVDKSQNINYPLIPTSIIISALQKDPISIKHILNHYKRYMIKLSLSSQINVDGYKVMNIDEFMLRQLETKLIEAILKFKIK